MLLFSCYTERYLKKYGSLSRAGSEPALLLYRAYQINACAYDFKVMAT